MTDLSTLRRDWDAAIDRHNAACFAETEAENSKLKTPAPDLAALAWKLKLLLAIEADGFTSGYSADLVEPVLADIDRLLA